MYIVRNMTNRTVILSDLRAEIGPHRILDLEKVVSRSDIDRSFCLRTALERKTLQCVKRTAIPVDPIPPATVQVVEKSFDEDRMKDLIREVMDEKRDTPDVENSVKRAVNQSMDSLIESIRDQIYGAMSGNQGQKKLEETGVDPVRLAELQQAAINKISAEIDDERVKKGKKIRIVNSKQNVEDIAGEL